MGIEHKNSCCGRGLVKGSQEAKDWAKKMADARKAKKVITKQTEPKVKIEMMGQPQLILPEYFAVQKKNGYKLVNPMTQERNLSKRKGETSVKIIRKPVENAVLLEGKDELIPLSLFSKKDRELVKSHFDKIEQNKEKSMEQKPVIQMPKPKERGRPERLPKNVEINKARNAGKAAKGRPVKYKTQEEAKKAKALSDKARYAKKKEEKKAKVGSGVISDINNIVNAGNRKIKNTIKRVSSVAKEVFYGATELPKPVQEILNKYGNEEIASITLMRTPVPQVLTGALSLFSAGEFGERMKERAFDELFHLFLEAKMVSGKRIQVEKNDRINMIVNPPSRPKTEIEPIKETLPSGLNLNTMMANTERVMGKGKFLGYSAKDNNCQDFLATIVKANNLGDSKDISFIKQDTKSLFKDLPYLRKLSNTLTNIGAKVNTIISGGGLESNDYLFKVLSNAFKKLTEIKQEAQQSGDTSLFGDFSTPFAQLYSELYSELMVHHLDTELTGAKLTRFLSSKIDEIEKLMGNQFIEYDIAKIGNDIKGKGASASIQSQPLTQEQQLTQLETQISETEHRIYQLLSFIQNPDNSLNPRLQSYITQLNSNMAIWHSLLDERHQLYLDMGYELGDEAKEIEGGSLTENNISNNNIRMEKMRTGKSCSTCPMCGAGVLGKIGKAFKKVGKDVASGLIHKALPEVVGGLAGSAATALTGDPVAGFAVEQTVGKVAGNAAGNALGKATGYGLKKPNAWIALVKKVQQEKGVSYKEAMTIASKMRKN